MNISKLMFTVVLGMALSAPAMAQQQAPAQGAPANGVKLDVTDIITKVDTNKDGSISFEEWKAAGINESLFTFFDSENKKIFSNDVMIDMTHPAAMDADSDGKLSLDEFKEFTKNHGQHGSDAAPPGGAPN